MAEKERLQMERKRKGKGPERPAKKKRSRLPSTTVRIQEPQAEGARKQQQQEDSEEEAPLVWERRTKSRHDSAQHGAERQAEVVPDYPKIPILLTNYELKQMLLFTDPKWEEDCSKRITVAKGAKSGKQLHQPSLEYLGVEENFVQYITGIGFEWLTELQPTKVPQNMAKEFFTSFRFKLHTTDLNEPDVVSFRLCCREWSMSLNEWSVRLGLYTAQQAEEGAWFGRDVGLPSYNPEFHKEKAWRLICHENAPQFKPTAARGIHIEDPVLRLAQVYLGYNILGQANTSSSITLAELYFMWCMKEQRKVHLGYWIANTCHQLATKPVRHLNVCHLLGAFIKNNLELEIAEGCHPKMCQLPESFNIKFFINVKILTQRGKKLFFYKVGQTDLPLVTADTEEREAEKNKDGEPTTASAPVGDQRGRLEDMVHALGQNVIAQRELLEAQTTQMTSVVKAIERLVETQTAQVDRAVDAMERMSRLVAEHFAGGQQSSAAAPASAQRSSPLPLFEGPRAGEGEQRRPRPREPEPKKTPSKPIDPKKYQRKK